MCGNKLERTFGCRVSSGELRLGGDLGMGAKLLFRCSTAGNLVIIFIGLRISPAVMDHLPRPISNLSRAPLAVPYVCTSEFPHDDLGFLSYPARVGVDLEELCSRDAATSNAAVSFMQAWLWFQLLGDTLGVGSRSHIPQKVASFESFIRLTEMGKRVICTEGLKMAAMRRRETTAFSPSKETHRDRFDSCLDVATRAVNSILQTPTARRQVATAAPFQDLGPSYLIILSIQILIDALRSFRTALFSTRPYQAIPILVLPTTETGLLAILLAEAGWCPCEAKTSNRNFSLAFVLSSIRQRHHRDGNRCSQVGCPNERKHDPMIQPHHTISGCSCELVGLSDSLINTSAEVDRIPLITFHGLGEGLRHISVLETSTTLTATPFVAFSHARHLGLGNSHSNNLPYCQLSLLQELANDSLPSSPKPVPFYIDTMTLPRSKPQKSLALQSLHLIFSSAHSVIVLEPSLSSVVINSALDALIRIRSSDWKHRLWTLQEGAVARKLRFKFANRTVDLDDILEEFEEEAGLSIFGQERDLDTDHTRDAMELLAQLQAFNADLKAVKEVDLVGSQSMKMELKAILRLGYLRFRRYRFFREEKERVQSLYVLQALDQVYPNGEKTRSKDLIEVERRVQDMYSICT
jgi:hypothetical protein